MRRSWWIFRPTVSNVNIWRVPKYVTKKKKRGRPGQRPALIRLVNQVARLPQQRVGFFLSFYRFVCYFATANVVNTARRQIVFITKKEQKNMIKTTQTQVENCDLFWSLRFLVALRSSAWRRWTASWTTRSLRRITSRSRPWNKNFTRVINKLLHAKWATGPSHERSKQAHVCGWTIPPRWFA